MINEPKLTPDPGLPLYRQVAKTIREQIASGERKPGDRLPPTRELAHQLGLNRTTVSAAYALLEESGLITGHVGRGSFVAAHQPISQTDRTMTRLDWEAILPPRSVPAAVPSARVHFAASRADMDTFPMAEFRRVAKDVIDSAQAGEILQLGSPLGYARLRRYLLEQARRSGTAREGDDLLITNGCQQALDLLSRVLVSSGETVILENPAYQGLVQVFQRTGADIVPAHVGPQGISPETLETLAVRHNPRAVVLTPSFHNPTGASIPAPNRVRILEIARRYGLIVVENGVYSELQYEGLPQPSLKQSDTTGNVILIRSYSKVSFPGLRIGWTIGPRPVIQRLAEFKQTCDLHSDQLSQAVMLRFAESGELDRHLAMTRKVNAHRLAAVKAACEKYLPGSRFSRPMGGLHVWVELAEGIDTRDLLMRTQPLGVNFVPGSYFAIGGGFSNCLRISFGGLSADEIDFGIRTIGEAAVPCMDAAGNKDLEPAPALV